MGNLREDCDDKNPEDGKCTIVIGGKTYWVDCDVAEAYAMNTAPHPSHNVPDWLVSIVVAIIGLTVLGIFVPIIIWLFRWAFGTVFG